MKLKKDLFLLFLLAFALNGFAQKATPEKTSTQQKAASEKIQAQQKATTDKSAVQTKTTAERTQTPKGTTDKTIVQPKGIAEKTPTPIQRQDSIKNLTVKVEPLPVDTITNLLLKFKPYKRSVHASYYHNKFNGKRTSSGQKFSNNNYTAAHRKFPFGTKLKITNEANGKSVIVEVMDRGPFSRGREIDLTRRAFMEIADNKNSGSMTVTIEEEKK